MRGWTDPDLLDAWERGLDRPAVERALALLAAAHDGATPADLAGLSIGRRDALLLELRSLVFGPRLVGLAECPGCGLRLELELDAADLRARSAPADGGGEEFAFEADGCAFRFRLPNSRDLAAATASGGDDQAAARRLLERCVLSARRGGAEVLPEEAPVAFEGLIEAMAEADPQADLRIAMTCPACGRGWHAGLDILTFFWSELQARASALLHEVHALASAYGWSESAVLALSPRRRRHYLEIARG